MLKRWARKYDNCVKCGTTKVPHEQHGLCTHCWNIKTYRKYKGYYKDYYKAYYKKHKRKIRARNKAYNLAHKPMLVCQSPSK